MLEEGSEFQLVLKFLDQSKSFALGFEAGKIYGQMDTRQPFDGTYHAENVDQLLAMAKTKNYRCIPTNSDGHWCNLKFEPIELFLESYL